MLESLLSKWGPTSTILIALYLLNDKVDYNSKALINNKEMMNSKEMINLEKKMNTTISDTENRLTKEIVDVEDRINEQIFYLIAMIVVIRVVLG